MLEKLQDNNTFHADYKIENIIGREYAKKTIVLPFVEEKSTTNIINKLKN
jgi:D-beta-D-heptose 7-phosphate kinase/D-beta-D-heptose 1-phosphate adenosyltransferase